MVWGARCPHLGSRLLRGDLADRADYDGPEGAEQPVEGAPPAPLGVGERAPHLPEDGGRYLPGARGDRVDEAGAGGQGEQGEQEERRARHAAGAVMTPLPLLAIVGAVAVEAVVVAPVAVQVVYALSGGR